MTPFALSLTGVFLITFLAVALGLFYTFLLGAAWAADRTHQPPTPLLWPDDHAVPPGHRNGGREPRPGTPRRTVPDATGFAPRPLGASPPPPDLFDWSRFDEWREELAR